MLASQIFENFDGSNPIPITHKVTRKSNEIISSLFEGINIVEQISNNILDSESFPSVRISQATRPQLLKDFSVQVTENILTLEGFLPVSTEQGLLSDLIKDIKVQVSENLFSKLKPPDKILGMNYSDRHWKVEKVSSISQEKTSKRPIKQTGDLKSIDYPLKNGKKERKTRKLPSFWDLIFVLLQPPLTLSKADDLFLPSPLRGYQYKGVDFLISNEHALLADDMGTGKTVMTIVSLKILMQRNTISHALILCPKSVIYEWEHHFDLWAPELVISVVRGVQNIRAIKWESPAHIYLTTYDTLRSDVQNETLSKKKFDYFNAVIVDEAHHIKNKKTSRASELRKLKPIFRWALTGTPIQNKLEDLEALFDFIYPKFLTPYDLYEEKIKMKIAPHFLRRRKIDILPDLPPKQLQDIWLEMSEEQRKIYETTEHKSQLEIEALGPAVTKQNLFNIMQKLKQICNFPPGEKSSPKLETLKDQLEEILDSGNKLIIFSQYITEGVDKLKVALEPYGVSIIEGGQSDSIRTNEILKFKNEIPESSTKSSILIASVRSGGEGLNLTEASYVIHFDHWWNPAVIWQAEDRVHRIGQTKSVNIYSYWMKDTIEERIFNILERKGLLIENVVDGLADKNFDDLYTFDDLYEILGMKRNEKQKPLFNPKDWQSLSLEEIRDHLYEIKPKEFEELVMELMHYLGYPNVRVTKATGDGGIDVISSRNTDHGVEKVAAQCKRYRGSIGSPIARDFFGAIKDDKNIVKGLLITTSEFTPDCIEFCTRNGIEFLSGLRVADYVRKFGLPILISAKMVKSPHKLLFGVPLGMREIDYQMKRVEAGLSSYYIQKYLSKQAKSTILIIFDLLKKEMPNENFSRRKFR